ncbi:GNAT family N-acetyltransferase [Sporosarcina oncorhynchi]|uniref:GNAT family N-acetyltransferase n=1 Tax=Sporosarcina oncorhynchi TaxID=3056444 RepID=A0ABZ0L4B1_9BACL|nr:GNAT family N-acetyltransferase [Sporosarcina sp. T2O-4]WOV87323.1 GNAT family N-acetyltransferase [Sporosarcina sp. T2O-4]
MNWYDKLSEYFPIEEMKSKEHMDALLKDKKNVYLKEEGPHHVLMLVETETFVFIDYLFVSAESRGAGLGRKLLDSLKAKGKPIILEVEPLDYEDTDSEKRLKFYAREHFRHASKIGYRRRSLATGEHNEMEILFWSPTDADEQSVYEAMKTTYEEIHTYKDETFYGDQYDPTDKVLFFDKEDKENILEAFMVSK